MRIGTLLRTILGPQAWQGVKVMGSFALLLCLLYTSYAPAFALENSTSSTAPTMAANAPLPGSAGLSSADGAFSHSYPIVVPPGRLGHEPQLALAYNSRGAVYGGLAAGWELPIPVIQVDTTASTFQRTEWIDGIAGSYQVYTSDLAGGARLVHVEEDAPADVKATYRAENDPSFARYHAMDESAPVRWRVLLPNGATYEFGLRDAANPNNKANEIAPLYRIVDKFGNSIVYDISWRTVAYHNHGPGYYELAPAVYYQLDRIRYGQNVGAGLGHHAEVRFTYEPERTCPGISMPIGARVTNRTNTLMAWGVGRLTAITTHAVQQANGPLRDVRRYELHYDETLLDCQARHAPRRQLIAIDEKAYRLDGGVDTMPRVEFSYAALENLNSRPWIDQPFSTNAPIYLEAASRADKQFKADGYAPERMLVQTLTDMDGDGLKDLVQAVTGDQTTSYRCGLVWVKNTGLAFDGPAKFIPLPTMPWANNASSPSRYEFCGLNVQKSNYQLRSLSHPDNHCDADEINRDYLPHFSSYVVYELDDFDYDGKIDLIASVHPNHDMLGNINPVDTFTMPPEAQWQVEETANIRYFEEVFQDEYGSELACVTKPFVVVSTSDGIHQRHRYPWFVYYNVSSGNGANTPKVHLLSMPHRLPNAISTFQVNSVLWHNGRMDMNGDGFLDLVSHTDLLEWRQVPYEVPIGGITGSLNSRSVYNGELRVSLSNGQGGFGYGPNPQGEGSSSYLTRMPTNFPPAQGPWFRGTLHMKLAASVGGEVARSERFGESKNFTGDKWNTVEDYFVPFIGWMDVNEDGVPDLVNSNGEALFGRGSGLELVGDPGGDTHWHYISPVGEVPEKLRKLYPANDPQNLFRYRFLGGARQYVAAHDRHDGFETIVDGRRYQEVALFDWDYDGYLDRVFIDYRNPGPVAPAKYARVWDGPEQATPIQAWISLNMGGLGFLPPRPVEVAREQAKRLYAIADVQRLTAMREKSFFHSVQQESYTMDVNGDGFLDYIYPSANGGRRVLRHDFGDQPPGALIQIKVNGNQGGVTRLRYAPTSDKSVVRITDPHFNVVAPFWVLKEVEVNPGSGQPSMVTRFRYENPARSRDHQGRMAFRGFRKVETVQGDLIQTQEYVYHAFYRGLLAESHTRLANGVYADIFRQNYKTLAPLGHPHLQIYQPHIQERFVCRDGQDYQKCLQAGEHEITEYTYVGLGNGPQPYLYMRESTLWYGGLRGDDPGSRSDKVLYHLVHDATNYRIAPTTYLRYGYDDLAGDNPIPRRGRLIGGQSFSYDSTHRVIVSHSFRVGDNSATRMTIAYDMATGQVVAIKRPRSVQQNGPATVLQYDPHKLLPTKITNDLGHVTRVTEVDYGTGQALAIVGPQYRCPDGGDSCTEAVRNYAQERYEYDGFGRLLKEWQPVDSGAGYALELVAEYQYLDDQQRLVIRSPFRQLDGLVATPATHVTTDGIGRTISIAQDGGGVTNYQYDDRGRLVRVRTPDPSATPSQVAQQSIYEYEYDGFGRLRRALLPDPDTGQPGHGGCDDCNYLVGEEHHYDGYRTIVRALTNDNGPASERHTRVNRFGDLLTVAERLDNGALAETHLTYDGGGNLRTVRHPDGMVTDVLHDGLGRRTQVRRGDKVWRYAYDHDSNLTHVTYPMPVGGNPTDYTAMTEYDIAGRPIVIHPPKAGLTDEQRAELAIGPLNLYYDERPNALGQLTRFVSPVAQGELDYGASGQVIQYTETLNVAALTGASINSALTQRWQYNAAGMTLSATYPARPGADPARAVTVQYTYDALGRPLTARAALPGVQSLAPLVHYSRNAAGLVYEALHGLEPNAPRLSGLGASVRFDRQGRPTLHLVNQFSSVPGRPDVPLATPVASEEVTYWDSGDVQLYTLRAPNLGTNQFSYEYDKRSMLKRVLSNLQYQAEFGYTAGGRLQMADVAVPVTAVRGASRNVRYDYDGVDPFQLAQLTVNDGGEQRFASYSFDHAGNMTAKTTSAGEYSYLYDGDQRLRKARHPGNVEETYYYLGDERVLAVERNADGSMRGARRFFNGMELRYDGQGNLLQTIVHADFGEPIARIVDETAVEYTVHSLQNHLLAALDVQGNVYFGAVYGPFGEVLKMQGNLQQYSQNFNDKVYDEVAALSYHGHRYYDPDSLLWNRADPLYNMWPDAAGGTPHRANLYSFAGNNPVSQFDPDGLDFFPMSELSWHRRAGRYYQPALKQTARQVKATVVNIKDATVTVGKTAAPIAWEIAKLHPYVAMVDIGVQLAKGNWVGAADSTMGLLTKGGRLAKYAEKTFSSGTRISRAARTVGQSDLSLATSAANCYANGGSVTSCAAQTGATYGVNKVAQGLSHHIKNTVDDNIEVVDTAFGKGAVIRPPANSQPGMPFYNPNAGKALRLYQGNWHNSKTLETLSDSFYTSAFRVMSFMGAVPKGGANAAPPNSPCGDNIYCTVVYGDPLDNHAPMTIEAPAYNAPIGGSAEQ